MYALAIVSALTCLLVGCATGSEPASTPGAPARPGFVDHAAEMERCKREIGKLEPAMARFQWGSLREVEVGAGVSRRIRTGQLQAPNYGQLVLKDFTCTFDDDGYTQFWVN